VKRNYYCQVAGLQDITLDIHKLSSGQLELRDELQATIHADDYLLVELLFLQYDNKNLINLMSKNGEEFDIRGNYPLALLEENIKMPDGSLPSYMDQFILSIKNDTPLFSGMSYENQLFTLYYEHAANTSNSFARNWFNFNKTLTNITTALLCRKYEVPHEFQVLGLDETTETIRRSHARDFGVASDFHYVEELISITKIDNFDEREKALDKIRWDYLDEITFFEYFTIDRILAFILKLRMVERWLAIDKKHGSQLFDELLQDLKSGYKLPKEFTDK